MNIGPYQKDKLWMPPADLEEKANPHHELGDGQSVVVVPARLRARACRLPAARASRPGKSDPSSYAGSGGLLRRDRMDREARLVLAATSARSAFRITRTSSGASPNCSRLRSKRSCRGKDAPTSIATRRITAASSRWASSAIGRTQQRTICSVEPRSYNPDAFNNNMMWNSCATISIPSSGACAARAGTKIKVPLYSVGNWGGFAMHLRGNTEGFMRAASKHKKLRIHSGTHFHPFHSEEGRLDQLRWFDHWLKGIDTGIMDEPPVKLDIRTGGEHASRTSFASKTSGRSRARSGRSLSQVEREQQQKRKRRAEGELACDARRRESGSSTYSASPPSTKPA